VAARTAKAGTGQVGGGGAVELGEAKDSGCGERGAGDRDSGGGNQAASDPPPPAASLAARAALIIAILSRQHDHRPDDRWNQNFKYFWLGFPCQFSDDPRLSFGAFLVACGCLALADLAASALTLAQRFAGGLASLLLGGMTIAARRELAHDVGTRLDR
jgi:hypothetical protein